jgi:hypothetical protein
MAVETAWGFASRGSLLIASIGFVMLFCVIALLGSCKQTNEWLMASVSDSSSIKQTYRSEWSLEQKVATIGNGVTGFGDCQPFCNRTLLKGILQDFIHVYKNKPVKRNLCGCLVNHCFAEYAVARLAEVDIMVENGVNAGMSGYLFRSAKPNATLYHVDPRSRPICNVSAERWYDPGADTGLGHYYVGPSQSKYYQAMVNDPNVGPEQGDAMGYAKSFHSKGFEDFFAIDWTDTRRRNTLVFFDTHQPDYFNILKALGMGFKLFLFDDNYNANDAGDMRGYSLKQVFARGGGEAKNLAYNLDFYYEMPPLISPYTLPAAIVEKYGLKQVVESRTPQDLQFDPFDITLGQKALLDLEDEVDGKLFEMLLEVVPVPEFGWYNHMAVSGKKFRSGIDLH